MVMLMLLPNDAKLLFIKISNKKKSFFELTILEL